MILTVAVVTVPAADAELGADRLMQAGAFAVEERTIEGGLVELRAVLAGDRLGELPTGWTLRAEATDSTAAETWRQYAAPIRVTHDLVVRPSWLPRVDEPGVTEAAIEPGATFGLGDHPTTRLCAAAVWRMRPQRTVLDVGTGSGVLAVVAALAGAGHVTAIDIADVSPAVVEANAVRNEVAGRITASTVPLVHVDGGFDLVVANILAPTLVAMAPDLVRLTAPGGTLLLSGLLAGRYDHVVAAMTPLELTHVETLEGWAVLTMQ